MMTTNIITTAAPTAASCPRCHHAATISAKHPVCARCREAIRREAAQAQERDYLVRYLSTRVDASGWPVESALTTHASDRREIARLVAKARRLHLDWTKPPAPLHFDKRMSALMAPYVGAGTPGNKRGRPARAVQVSFIGQDVLAEGGAA